MDRAKKKFASALDGLRGLHPNKQDIQVDERIQPDHCCLKKIVRHGFPDDARCMAYDPVQKLLAIGTGHGTVRVIGDAGVDYLLRHPTDHPVLHAQFLVNEGGLITACANDLIHLWNFRQKRAEVVHSLQLNKESVTCIHLPISSKWLYVGTDKGNIYVVSVGTFQMSSYVINWNKAIDLSCRVHPGPVRQLSACPTDPGRLLICYDKGVAVVWNLATKEVDRFPLDPPIKSVSWHYDGRQVMTGNVDGSLSVYSLKKTSEAVQRSCPHGAGSCRPVPQLEWRHSPDGEQLVVFSGGMPTDDGLPVPALTILKAARSATVMEMDHPIISFCTLPQNPYPSTPQQPHAVAVLLKSDLMLVDLTNPSYPLMESPHAMDVHESPVTCVEYHSDCPSDLVGALTLVGCKQRKKGFSDRTWPVTGGAGRECATGHQEVIITGHKDGTVRFWQASGEHLQILYRLKAASHFERLEENEEREVNVTHSIKEIKLCVDSRLLLVTGHSGQATLFRFAKTETQNAIAVVNIPQLFSAASSSGSQEERAPSSGSGGVREMRRQKKIASRDSNHSSDTEDGDGEERIVPFKVRGAPVKRPAGYQPELAMLVPWPSACQSDPITACALNSAYGVVALGTSGGLALVDIAQCALIYAWTSAELYGSEPTPAVQLTMGGGGDTSPVEMRARRSATMLVRGGAAREVVRRNTTSSAFRRDNGYSPNLLTPDVPDRPEVDEEEEREEKEERPKSRSIMRRLTEKGSKLARSLSMHSHSNGDEAGGGEGAGGDSAAEKRERMSTTSPSVSLHSLERVGLGECVTSLHFIHSSCKRGDARSQPCLWVGTSSGAAIALNLLLPQDRVASTVVVAPSGTVVKLKGQMLYQAFLDSSFCVTQPASEPFKEPAKERDSPEKVVSNRVVTKPSLSPSLSSVDQTDDIAQMLVSISEYEVRVVALPSFGQLFHHKCDDIPIVKARCSHVRGYPVLMLLTAAGSLQVLSLPSLRVLNSASLIPHSIEIDDPICAKTAFSEHGLGVYMTSNSEIEKYTVCNELAEQVDESIGDLFVPADMPEPPRNTSFFKGVSGLFGGNTPREPVDLDSIFVDKPSVTGAASSAATGMRSVGKTIPGPAANMERAQAGGISAGQAAAMAIQNLNERGDRLAATVDVTENLRNNALNLSQRTGKLVEKYEKKKWYNF